MSYLTNIKLSQVTNLSDARYAAAAGLNAISFCFDEKHPRFVAPLQARQMMDWLSGIAFIGEFNGDDANAIREVVELTGLHQVQLKGNYTAADIEKIGVEVIWEADSILDIPAGVAEVQIAVHNAEEWRTFAAKQMAVPLIMHPMFNDNALLTQLIAETKPYCVSLSSGDEPKPGMRDFADLNELLDALRVED